MRLLSHPQLIFAADCGTKDAVRAEREKIELPEGNSFRVLRWTRSVEQVDCVVGPAKKLPMRGQGTHWHYHAEMELTLFSAGEGTRFVGDHIESFGGGDLVLLGTNLPHYWHTKGPSDGVSVQWHFPEEHGFWTFPENLALRDLFRSAGRGLRYSGETAAGVAVLMRELLRSEGSGRFAVLLNILERLNRSPKEEVGMLSNQAFTLDGQSVHQRAVAESVRYLLGRFREEVRLEDLLRLTGMSRATFSRQFKRHSGRSFGEFLNGLRLQAACRELLQGDASVLETALGCGFTQISFFNRYFRRCMGCSPRVYRARSQKGE
jgi:AraC-like DNA-binding protein/mannose-6-phosphate isomerase-like protein (cupin superfamily)